MPQRFKLRDSNPWIPVLLMFSGGLYTLVQVMDKGFGALSIWFVIPLAITAFFLFRSRTNYVELAEGHLKWVQWGNTIGTIGLTEIDQVTTDGKAVNVHVPRDTPAGGVVFFRRKWKAGWAAIPATDPQGLLVSLEHSLSAYRGPEINPEATLDEPQAPPRVDLVPPARWRRLAAIALDGFFIVSLLFVVSLALTADLQEGEERRSGVFGAVVVVIAAVVYVFLINIIGISFGKMQFGLRLVRTGTDRAPGLFVGAGRALVALSGYAVSLVALFFIAIPFFYVGTALLMLDSAWALVDKQRRALHDIVARTSVVQIILVPAGDQRYPELVKTEASPDLLPNDQWRRFIAHVVDLIVVGVIWYGSWLAFAIFVSNAIGKVASDSLAATIITLAVYLSAPFYWFVYHWLLTSVGCTAGKRLTSLRIRTESDSSTPTLATAFKRTAILLAAIVPLGLGIWLPLLRRRPFWHDKATGTNVVRVSGSQRLSAAMATADSPTH